MEGRKGEREEKKEGDKMEEGRMEGGKDGVDR